MSSSNSRKKQRTTRSSVPALGAPSEADEQSNDFNNPTSSASSSRVLPTTTIPSLSTLCARRFAASYKKIRENEFLWKATAQYLKLAPDSMIPKILAMLVTTCPTFLDHAVIVTYFLRGPLISLDMNKLPGVKESTILQIPRLNPSLREVELTKFGKISDEKFASVFSRLTELRRVVLRDCTKVGLKTVVAIAKSCPHLKIANLNHTSSPPAAVGDLLLSCPQLEVLKLAGISNWTDGTFSKLAKALDKKTRFVSLRTLKLRMLSLSDNNLNFMVSLFPNLRRLDLSFTPARHLLILSSPESPDLEKISLTSTQVTSSDLLAIIARLPCLKTLSLGALGVRESSKATVSNSSAMTMNDYTLREMTAILTNFQDLESVSLVANTKLCINTKADSAVLEFVQQVGRRCKYLNLSGIPSIRSNDLVGLIAEVQHYTPPALERLLLNQTGVDDGASASICSCRNLVNLGLSGTRFTSVASDEGLFPILDACTRLEHLDLTSCRGVPVGDRRRFFQVWEGERNPQYSVH
ncbi:hypothetical protein E1B28_001256 [Marasmius oreades]|uniref:RNI-like protein n=1 Tax=Marasmius oreades TaxID=181124 RepID=A0A9P8AFC4_9AGAR|nr:uncharacterized protein E1B28_001256 [Marasmius oreades]KAG7099403.1 hypothetical protein E1B28_001256 [Marasmius oreades]